MPRFTAEASLYKTSGHYRTGRVNLSAEMIRTIHPAREVIEIHDCPPGESRLGGTGPCWPDPLTEPSVGQGGESSGSGGAGEGSGPGGGVSHGKPPKDKPKATGKKSAEEAAEGLPSGKRQTLSRSTIPGRWRRRCVFGDKSC